MPIFVIQIASEKERLIEASSKKAAIAHAMPVIVTAAKASAADVAQLMANGTKVEKAQ